ncbi:MAG: hypothetical protein ACKO24_18410 [Leptolyngbyaceae cyanobacterium]
MPFHSYFLAVMLAGAILAACNSPTPPPPTEALTTAPSPVGSATVPASRDSKAQFTGMQTVITDTQAALNGGDVAKAQATFAGFESYWEQVEDGVKAKSAETYKEIEDDMDTIAIGLKGTNPDKVKVVTALQSLSKKLTDYASTLQ